MTSHPNPALVPERAARRLPRWALLLFCAAYVLPGVFGRDPWRNADLTAFGQMLAMAEQRSSWLVPAIGGVPTGAALLPNWVGAAAIAVTRGWLDPALAARLPFAALLALTLAAVWYACYHLARREAAQPVAFAFGGEASPVDYARAVADGAVLAMIASLGLLQLGHETTPELGQLACVAGYQWALAVAPHSVWRGRWGALAALAMLAACGAPAMAVAFGVATAAVLVVRAEERLLAAWCLLCAATAAAVGMLMHAWGWRLTDWAHFSFEWPIVLRMLLWFLWPVWLLGLWTLWRWRRHLGQRHFALPAASFSVALAACVAMGGFDRAMMLGLPGIAVLASFALPTLRRSTSAAIDWFSVFFFTACALAIWVVQVSLLTGVPATPARNVARLAPGFEAVANVPALVFAATVTAAWIWLVRWRTKTHRPELWKSLVLPAGGVALCWSLLMSLWLPMLDYARSQRPLVTRLSTHVGSPECVWAPAQPHTLTAALEVHGRWKVDAASRTVPHRCSVMVRTERAGLRRTPPAGWQEVARVRRPTERQDEVVVYRRVNG